MKKIKKYLNKKEYIIFALSLVIILLSTFSFAFYLNTDNTLENVVTSECFKLSFEDQDDIYLDKAYPLSDSEGSNLKPYIFTVKNVCNRAGDYQVNIETLNNSTLSTNYLKYKLDNQTPSILGNQLEVQEYINNNVSESRNIETNLILPNEEKTYNLRLWIDEESTFEQTSEKEYSGKVVVKTLENKEPYQTITLNPNGGEITQNEIIRVKTRSIGNIPEPTKEDYHFLGWYLDSSLKNKIDNNTIVTNDMNNLYAKWYKYVYRFNYTGASQSFVVPDSGEYKVELWGAGGKSGSYGAYTSGNIVLSSNEILHVYVGQQGFSIKGGANTPYMAYNGGGISGSQCETYVQYGGYNMGGGATDVRLESGTWDSLNSLKSRIMVAGAGGGSGQLAADTGSGGGLIGYDGIHRSTWGTGATQTAGGSINGGFGIGGTGKNNKNVCDTDGTGGGGGGYYGGGGSQSDGNGTWSQAGGGSSFISGHTGCVAITSSSSTTPKSGCTTGTTNNSCSIHYSGYKFTDTIMIDGQGYSWTNAKGSLKLMPNPTGGNYASGVGNNGNGYAKITFLTLP